VEDYVGITAEDCAGDCAEALQPQALQVKLMISVFSTKIHVAKLN